jgi:aqualysin 1
MQKNKFHPATNAFKIFVFLMIAMLAFGNMGVTPTLASTSKAPMLQPASDEVIPDQYIVIYKRGIMTTQADISIRASVQANGGQVQYVYTSAIKGFSARLPEAALNAVLSDPNVAYVEPDVMISLPPEEQGGAQEAGDIAADDVNAQAVQTPATWGLDRIDQSSLPLTNSYTYNERGDGVHVYIIDTGIRTTHTQFGGRATKNFDSIGDGQAGNDCDGHGTHVAGTVGGSTYGVAKLVRLHAVRVLNCLGSGSYSGVIAGVDWVANNHIKPAVANMSLGGPALTTLDNAVNGAVNKGVVMVVAAGNETTNACTKSPARASKAITVGATDITDFRSWFSNFGSCLDIFAPGSSITSAWITSNTAINTISGTSMAAPHVAGVAALYLEVKPNATPSMVTYGIINAATLGKVSDPVGSPDRLLYSRQVARPKLLDPKGNITDTTPTFQWKYVFAANLYRFQVYEGATLVYTETVDGAATCSGLVCSFTPATVLPSGAYKWYAQAKIDGVWQPLSPFKAFNIVP